MQMIDDITTTVVTGWILNKQKAVASLCVVTVASPYFLYDFLANIQAYYEKTEGYTMMSQDVSFGGSGVLTRFMFTRDICLN